MNKVKARITCYGIDDELKNETSSIFTTNINSTTFPVPAPIPSRTAPIIEGTRTGVEAVSFTQRLNSKKFKFSLNPHIRNLSLSKNARLIIESITIPNVINDLYLQSKCVNNVMLKLKGINNHNIWDSSSQGKGSSIIFTCPMKLNTQGFGRTLDTTNASAKPDLNIASQKGRLNCDNNGILFINSSPNQFYNFPITEDFLKNGILEFDLIYDIGNINKLSSANGQVTSLTLTNGGSFYTEPATVSITGDGTGATAQVSSVSYSVANVHFTTTNSGYSSGASILISPPNLVTGIQATGTPIIGFPLGSTFNTHFQVTNSGSAYGAPPTAVISPPPPVLNAYVTVTVTAGSISGYTIIEGGFGYYATPIITITGGGGNGAVLTPTITGTRITAFTITNAGTGYTSAPTVTITGGGGVQATATIQIFNGQFNGLTLTNAGSGYLTTSLPTITLTPTSGGSGMTIVFIALNTSSGGMLKGLTMTNTGSGYTSAPTILIQNGGSGTGATPVARLTNGVVTGLYLATSGSGYSSPPTVTITGANGVTSATATANITINEVLYTQVPQTLDINTDKNDLEAFMISMVITDEEEDDKLYNDSKMLNKINKLLLDKARY